MNKILRAIKSAPKSLYAIIGVFLLAVVVPIAANAWGPNRQTFTVANPAPFITFNSITDNPHIGDERNFVGARERGTNNLWSSNLQVQRGREYVIRLYVHNNAADNLGLVAENVRALVNVPTATGRSHTINGGIESSNATPQRVWDNTTLWANEDFNLYIVPGTIMFHNNHFTNGVALSDNLFTSNGALLGWTALDGRIPGCFRYDGVVTFVVRPQFAEQAPQYSFTVDKHVRRLGQTGADSWQKTITAQPGSYVEYQIHFRNTSSVTVENVMIRDILPAHVSYVAGTTLLFNTNHPDGVAMPDGVTTTGINIGSYLPNGDAFVRFRARIGEASVLNCGVNQLVNRGQADVPAIDGPLKEETATVNVTRECEDDPYVPTPPEVPPELPVTGASVIGSIIGLGSLATSGAYYWISRRKA